MTKKTIVLAGFGDFSENEDGLKDLTECANRHGTKLTPTYYDHQLEGSQETIEAITKAMWGMSADEWADNGLTIIDHA